jgi:hypothetical protein
MAIAGGRKPLSAHATSSPAARAKAQAHALNLKDNNPQGAPERVYTMLEFLGLDEDVQAALDQATCKASHVSAQLNLCPAAGQQAAWT